MNEAERHLLMAAFDRRKRRPYPSCSIQEVQQRIVRNYGKDALDVGPAIPTLVAAGLLNEDNGSLSLTAAGAEQASDLIAATFREGFEEGLTRLFSSEAHRTFCQQVYGTGLQQLNMVDAPQLDHLKNVLGLKPNHKVIDLGCATGLIAEHLSDQSSAHITGLDFAPSAIAAAEQRTRTKGDRLRFVVGDLNSLNLPANSFDVALSVDTLYFVKDLPSTVNAILNLLCAGGRLAAFWSEQRKPEEAADSLQADNTTLARALAANQATWDTWDFTEAGHALWRRYVSGLEQHKAAFEAEGNLEMHDELHREAEMTLDQYDQGLMSRHLYLVKT